MRELGYGGREVSLERSLEASTLEEDLVEEEAEILGELFDLKLLQDKSQLQHLQDRNQ